MAETMTPDKIKSPADILTYFKEEAQACKDFTGSDSLIRARKDRDKDVPETQYMTLAAGTTFEAILRITYNIKDPTILKAFNEFVQEYFLLKGGMNNLATLYEAALKNDAVRLNQEMTRTFETLYVQFSDYFKKTFHGDVPQIAATTKRAVNDTVPDDGASYARIDFADRMAQQVPPNRSARAVRGGLASPR